MNTQLLHNDLKDNRRGGFYFKNTIPYVSVTTVLNETVKNYPLEYWQMRQVYLSMVKNPSQNEKEALSAPYSESRIAMDRGTTVHDLVEAYDNNNAVKTTEKYQGYLEAYKKFISDYQVKVLRNEESIFSEKYHYAGTLDKIVKVKNSDRLVILDVKTSKSIYDEYFLQLSAYKNACIENRLVKEADIAVIRLTDKGNYGFAYGDYDLETFLAIKKIWEWKNKDKLLKVGYLERDKDK